MSTILPYPYVHTVNYFEKGIDANGPYYMVEYLLSAYSETDTFINALLGKTTLAGGSGGTINSFSPHQHPLSPNLYCQAAKVVDGLGGPSLNADGYPYYAGGALIRAEYRPLQWDAIAQPEQSFDPATPIVWATQELDFGVEIMTVQNATYTFSSGPQSGQTSGIPVAIKVPVTTMILTYEKLPYLPMAAARSLRYRVNSSTFLGSAAGLVLFEGCRTSRQFNSDGSVAQKVQLVFKERDGAYPWNSLPSKTSLRWYPVSDGSGNKLYQTADLSPLILIY
jgi:hypothetical protein